MADFTTEAELSIVVPRRELRSARQEVEDALADIPVGMSSSGGGGAGGATNAAREQRRRRREFRWARQRTDDTEAQLEILENIEGELTEGGLGGGGGIAGDIIGLGGETAGIATDIGSTLVEALPSALGSLAGTALGQRFGGDGGGGGAGAAGPLEVKKPEWVPIRVEEPEGDGLLPDIDDLPSLPLPSVDDLPTLPLPDFLSGGPEPLPIEEAPTIGIEDPPVLTVEKPEWVPIQVDVPTGGGNRRVETPPTTRNRGNEFRTPLEVLSEAGRQGAEGALVGGAGGAAVGAAGAGVGAAPGALVGAITGGAGGFGLELLQAGVNRINGSRGGGSSTSTNTPEVSSGDVNITVNADVQSTVQSVVDELRREQERQRQELRNDLENQITNLERQINSGGRGGSGLGGSIT